MRAKIIAAGERALAKLRSEKTNKLARAALLEEAADFTAYVKTLSPSDLRGVKTLPHQRVLSEAESKQLWKTVRRIWNFTEGPWFPLKPQPVPSHTLAFHRDYFESIHGEALLREALAKRGINLVFLLHEFGDPEYEIELESFAPQYADGGEQYSTSSQTDWLVYASHESSITISGEWLVDFFRQLHPDCTERTYGGPFSTPDLRGTWRSVR
jgi:hypothetical protein